MKGPPSPFKPAAETLAKGHGLFRVFTNVRSPTAFNPGGGGPTRFAFFGNPVVPILYAADTEEAAIAESLLHDIPEDGGVLPYDKYSDKVLALLTVTRDLRLAVYPTTVKWAEAAHGIGLDGLVWMSRLCNTAKAYVFFGDRCDDAFTQDASHARIFGSPADQIWLIDFCAPLHIDVLLQST